MRTLFLCKFLEARLETGRGGVWKMQFGFVPSHRAYGRIRCLSTTDALTNNPVNSGGLDELAVY
jgi:hypothetical protein